jgi:hypothetical protein
LKSTGLIVPKNTGTVESPELELVVLARIVEEATCDTATNKGPCTFAYKPSKTLEVTSITPRTVEAF